jgi:hypothetical protein
LRSFPLAAEVLANHLRLGLSQIDLAAVVSGTILFFDEGDALLGQRSEVKAGHDRYANMEIDCLLQRMEDCGGVDILTTNCRWSYDWVAR